ncbi:GNAT family N-acetyltransferase [Streptomyces sp. NPDC059785]|uniref:GNAT family N-acetyltransferase n=1 Tax=unclassified Streptomyces TaxID=2593676 RepID=UPI00365B1AB6
MTIIRAARGDELPGLVRHPGDPGRDEAAGAYLADMLAKKCTRPQWCLVAEDDDGRLRGSVVLWTFPGDERPRDLVLLDAPWDEPGLATGEDLVRAAAGLARSLGVAELGHALDSPVQAPQFQDHPRERAALLRRCGFRQVRDGLRFRRAPDAGLPTQDERLTLRPLPELGRAPFVGLLTELLADTADLRLAADVARHGPRGAAELLFTDMEGYDHEPGWWELGFTPDGTAAAISLPARNPVFPVIGFVGVAPAQRGKGYATAMVARGTRVLVENGAGEIRGDCDAANLAMAKGFERAGYENFASRLEFTARL